MKGVSARMAANSHFDVRALVRLHAPALSKARLSIAFPEFAPTAKARLETA
jgi:hypothetical protein